MRIVLAAFLLSTAWAADRAPDFSLKDAHGATVRLSESRGKIVLLDFWATECGGCKVEIPWFAQISRDYQDRGVKVIGISMDILYENLHGPAEAWRRVLPFLSAHAVSYPVLMGDDRVTKAYAIEALPLTLLIDRHGRVVARHPAPPRNGASEFRQEIEALLR